MSHPHLLLADEDQTTRTFWPTTFTADGYHAETLRPFDNCAVSGARLWRN